MKFFAASVANGAQAGADEEQRDLGEQRVSRIAALGEMTGGISHDLRNVLALIESGLNLAERHIDDPASLAKYLTAAHDGVARGLILTNQLLKFADAQRSNARLAHVNELLEEMRLFVKYGAGSDVRVRMTLGTCVPRCLIDPSHFSSAILNLVVNARDASGHGGLIEIETRLASDGELTNQAEGANFVRVSVRDQGTGMSEEVAQRIFDPYFTTKGEGGTGLGLPQVYASMKQIDGFVRVSSEPRIGTTFDLFFPVPLDAPPRPMAMMLS